MGIGNEGETLRQLQCISAYKAYREAVENGASHEEIMTRLREWLSLDEGTSDYVDIR